MPLTLKDWLAQQPKIRTIDALDLIWKDWCQDPKCPNYPWPTEGTKLRIKLPEDYIAKTKEG